MAPGHIQILLEVYCFPNWDQCVHLRHDVHGSNILTSNLITEGLIMGDPCCPPPAEAQRSGFIVTEKGRCYINALVNLPLPTQSWEVKL